MIEVCLRRQNRIDVGMNVSQTFADPSRTRTNSLIQRCGPQTNAREIWIDQERVAAGFKLKSINAEISDANRV